MANSKITWANKESLVTDPTIAEINKVTDSNMNEIKDVVNENADQVILSDTEPTSNDNEIWVDTSENATYINQEVNIGATNVSNTPVWFKQNTKNLLNFNTINATITNTGNYTYSNARLTFDYIPMEADKQIIFSCNTTTSFMGIAYYNSNKQYISRDTNNSQSNISVTTPANTKYVRPFINIADNIPINNSSINQYEMQLEYGNIRTTFEALINPSIIIDERTIYEKGITENYSTEEQVIGTWLGKPLYRKVVDFGALPNNTEKQVVTNLTSSVIITKIYGISNYTQNNATYTPIPYVDPADLIKSIQIIVRDYGTKVGIKTAMDYSGFSAKVILEYTKTTD